MYINNNLIRFWLQVNSSRETEQVQFYLILTSLRPRDHLYNYPFTYKVDPYTSIQIYRYRPAEIQYLYKRTYKVILVQLSLYFKIYHLNIYTRIDVIEIIQGSKNILPCTVYGKAKIYSEIRLHCNTRGRKALCSCTLR